MRIIKNNYKPVMIKKRCHHCDSLIELNVDTDVWHKRDNNFIETGDATWCCPCCNKYNIIEKFYK